MAEAALVSVNQWLETNILQLLAEAAAQEGDDSQAPIDIFQTMCEETNLFFDQGHNSCLWAVLMMEQSSNKLFHSKICWAFSQWVEAISKVLVTAGLDETLAKQRGEDAMIAIQGALILSRGLDDISPFRRVIQQLPQQLCQDL